MVDYVALTHLLREMRDAGYTGSATYDRAYRAVLNGRIAADLIDGRWVCRRAVFPEAAAALGMMPPASQSSAHPDHVAA